MGKIFAFSAWVVFAICLIIRGAVVGQRAEVYVANFALVLQEVTPERKSAELATCIAIVKNDKLLPTHDAVVWPSAENRLENQVAVLEDLKQLCDNLIPLNKESMGYAEGVNQINSRDFRTSCRTCRQHVIGGFILGYYSWLCYFAMPLGSGLVFLLCVGVVVFWMREI